MADKARALLDSFRTAADGLAEALYDKQFRPVASGKWLLYSIPWAHPAVKELADIHALLGSSVQPKLKEVLEKIVDYKTDRWTFDSDGFAFALADHQRWPKRGEKLQKPTPKVSVSTPPQAVGAAVDNATEATDMVVDISTPDDALPPKGKRSKKRKAEAPVDEASEGDEEVIKPPTKRAKREIEAKEESSESSLSSPL